MVSGYPKLKLLERIELEFADEDRKDRLFRSWGLGGPHGGLRRSR